MENNNLPINSSSIVNILTLRYDQNLRPNLPIKTWDDFKPNIQSADINFIENYLVYIDKIESVNIDENSEEYKEYSNLAKIKIANELYNTYDNYIKSRYEIEINYQALETVKNYFN